MNIHKKFKTIFTAKPIELNYFEEAIIESTLPEYNLPSKRVKTQLEHYEQEVQEEKLKTPDIKENQAVDWEKLKPKQDFDEVPVIKLGKGKGPEKDKVEPFNVTYQQGIADQPSPELPDSNPIEKPGRVDVDETMPRNLLESREVEQDVESIRAISDENKNKMPDPPLNEVILKQEVHTGNLKKSEKWVFTSRFPFVLKNKIISVSS
jgi:hypothetical protein